MKKANLLLLLGLFFTIQTIVFSQSTSYGLPEGPYGGGAAYSAIIGNTAGYTIVSNYPALQAALANSSIHYIYIADNTIIDVPCNEFININRSNVVLAGGRGKLGSIPGKISRQSNDPTFQQNAIKVTANNVRITGLIIEGPYTLSIPEVGIGNTNLSPIVINGIYVNNGYNVEIDNCLIFNWTGSGLRIDGNTAAQNAKVHHNIFKHNNSEYWSSASSFGYGISLFGTNVEAIIAYNLFENNKHAIAGSAVGGESYTAVYNCVLPNNVDNRIDHSFDMHGFYDRYGYPNAACPNPQNACNYAGNIIQIENNYFERLRNNQEAVVIRGIPKTGAAINNNFLETTLTSDGIVQQFFPCAWNQNCPGSETSNPAQQINIASANNAFGADLNYFNVSWNGSSNWKLIAPFVWDETEIGVGDFNGDGVDDLFRSANGKWYVSSKGSGNWTVWGTSNITASSMLFEDFSNDGKTDILVALSGTWFLAKANSSGTGFLGWANLGSLGTASTMEEVLLGDFDNNGYTDLFRTAGGKWYCAYNFNASFNNWIEVGSSSYSLSDMAVGDFDGNGYADIFNTGGGNWQISYVTAAGFGGWQTVGLSSYGVNDLQFADFDADQDMDVFLSVGQNWYVSYSNGYVHSFTGWGNPINPATVPATLFLGDFDGDGRCDVGGIDAASTYDQSNYSVPTTTLALQLQVCLEGPQVTTGNMTNTLQQLNLLPARQPYQTAPWCYPGNEGAGWTAANYPPTTVDWVLVSLRTTPNPNAEIAKLAAPLLQDGSITATVSLPTNNLPNAAYLVIEHRNHLPAMTVAPVARVNNTLTYDFTSGDSYSVGAGFGQKLVSGSWCLFSGNADQSNSVGYEITGTDNTIWSGQNGNFQQYLPADYNLDGDVNAGDKVFWELNNGVFSAVPK